MSYYLKKHWKFTVLTIVLAVVLQLVQANISLLMMQMFDALLALDYRAFLFWCIVELAVWGSYSGLEALRNWSYNYTVRKLIPRLEGHGPRSQEQRQADHQCQLHLVQTPGRQNLPLHPAPSSPV